MKTITMKTITKAKTHIFLVLSFLLPLFTLKAQIEVQLEIGDNAPNIFIETWIKGTPITGFQPGQIYVMEFGSISCAPCRASIPHMSHLAKKYASELTLVSVFVYENGWYPSDTTSIGYIARVEQYIDRIGEGINYSVAVDGPSQRMAKSWLRAAGQNGIPRAFVIDQRGILVWIGNPMDLEDVIEKVIEHDFDPQLGVKEQLQRDSLFREIKRFTKNGNYKEALRGIDSMIDNNPTNSFLPLEKFNILLKSNENEAYTYGWKVLDGRLKDVEPLLYYLARSIKGNASKLVSPDWNLVIALTERAFMLSNDDIISAFILELQAEAYSKIGDHEKAINVLTKAIDNLKTSSPGEFEDVHLYFERKLREFEYK